MLKPDTQVINKLSHLLFFSQIPANPVSKSLAFPLQNQETCNNKIQTVQALASTHFSEPTTGVLHNSPQQGRVRWGREATSSQYIINTDLDTHLVSQQTKSSLNRVTFQWNVLQSELKDEQDECHPIITASSKTMHGQISDMPLQPFCFTAGPI